jgi:hypothetical protein
MTTTTIRRGRVAAAIARAPALAALDEEGGGKLAITFDEYLAERQALLAHVPLANPRFSKLAFGLRR